MQADLASVLVHWIADVTKRHGTPLVRQGADERVLCTAISAAIAPVVSHAAAPSQCAARLKDRFSAPAEVPPGGSLALVPALHDMIAAQVAASVLADPEAWGGQDASDPGWPAGQFADAVIGALRQATMDSVVSYLQARGLLTLTFGYYAAKYEALRPKDHQRMRGPDLIPFLKGFWELCVNLGAVAKHLPEVMWISLRQAVTQTVAEALRAAPAMLAVIIFLFLTSDAWKIFGSEAVWRIAALLVLLMAVSVIFFFAGAKRANGSLIDEITPTSADAPLLAARTPAAFWIHDGVVPDSGPLSRVKTLNVNGIYAVLMIGNFVTVGFLTALALICFGMLAFNSAVQGTLLGTKHIVGMLPIASHQFVLTSQLIVVSLMLAGIAVLSFAVSLQSTEARATFCGANITDLKSCLSAFYYFRAAAEHM
jgi:hypothetical protein